MDPVNIKDSNPAAVGDGLSHPLSGLYATLADAKAVFPFVTSLSQEIDWAVIQAALWEAGSAGDPRGTTVLVPHGSFVCSDDLRISRQVRFAGMGRGATKLAFTPGKGVIVEGPVTAPGGGDGAYSMIADMDITSDR